MQNTILCYGDSNTWGYVPMVSTHALTPIKRFSRDERWPGVLQALLGSDYYVIEEGLNGRTTNLEYHFNPDRNGKTYLPSCLYTHSPIDLVILSLGGNDLKFYFNRKPDDIVLGLKELIDIIQTSKYGPDMQESPRVLIIPPPIPHSLSENFIDENGITVFKGARAKAEALIDLYADLAVKKKCYFLNNSENVSPSDIDGLHFDRDGHKEMAIMLAEKISNIFKNK